MMMMMMMQYKSDLADFFPVDISSSSSSSSSFCEGLGCWEQEISLVLLDGQKKSQELQR